MIIHVIGGFLGSGKTTLLLKIAERYIGAGKKVTILVNEVGDIGVDGKTISGKGLDSVELEQGCICCSLAGTLQSTMRKIEQEFDPEVLIIEPTGLALPHKVREIIRGTVEEGEVSTIGIIDAYRFRLLQGKKDEFMRMQLSKSDVIWINKVDIADEGMLSDVKGWLRDVCPRCPVYMVSGLTSEGLDEAFEGSLFL